MQIDKASCWADQLKNTALPVFAFPFSPSQDHNLADRAGGRIS